METREIGNFIKKRRKELGLSQLDIAEFLSVSIPTVSKWENNERVPDLSLFSLLSKILEVDLESLMEGKSTLKNNYDIENEFNIDAFAKYFSYLRKRNNFTLSSLAKALDISYQTISKWENKESVPTIYTLIECAKIFKVSLSEIYYGKEFKNDVNENKKSTNNKLMFGLISVFLLIAIIVSTILINNNNQNTNDIQKDFVISLNGTNSAVINEYNGNKKEVVIPSTIIYNEKEVEVKEISFNLLGEFKDIEKLTIPFVGKTDDEGENNYLGYLFGATSFSFNEFYVPKSLKEVIITNAKHVIKYAFYNCKYIEKVILPNNLENIGQNAFLGCDNLKYNNDEQFLYLGNEKNKYFALLSPVNNEEVELFINDNVKVIGREAFQNCNMLTTIEISRSVKYICEDSFMGLKNIKGVYYLGTLEDWCKINLCNFRSNPLYLSDSSFYLKDKNNKYQKLTDIIIPDSINIIGKYQFDGFTNINSVYIGDNVISIEDVAFGYCSSLKSIFIPKSVVKIGNQILKNCENIKIYCEAEEQPAGWSEQWHYYPENVTWGCSRE